MVIECFCLNIFNLFSKLLLVLSCCFSCSSSQYKKLHCSLKVKKLTVSGLILSSSPEEDFPSYLIEVCSFCFLSFVVFVNKHLLIVPYELPVSNMLDVNPFTTTGSYMTQGKAQKRTK